MKLNISKKQQITVEPFKGSCKGNSFVGIRIRIGMRNPKTLLRFHHSKALLIIDALNDCIAQIDDEKSKFFESREWQRLRYQTLKRDRQCVLCGSKENLHCDHIKPRSKYPELALDPENLQTLCMLCNLAKSNTDDEDFRR